MADASEDQALTDGFAALALCRTCGALVIDARGHHRYHEAQRTWAERLVRDIERAIGAAGFRRRARGRERRGARPDTDPSV